MFAVVLILTFSGILFLYWFRYCCLLILQTRSAKIPAAEQNAQSLGLAFPGVRTDLNQPVLNTQKLDRLNSLLIRDFSVLGPLLGSSAGNVDPILRWMLVLDYWLLRAWFGTTRRLAPPRAQAALLEISHILGFFSGALLPPTLQHNEA